MMNTSKYIRYGAAIAVIAAAASFALPLRGAAAILPQPAIASVPGDGPQMAVLSGGCFWGVQGVFEHVKGVTRVVSGYSGGNVGSPSYEMVSTGDTGHAESVQISYDPKQISYGEILRIYFSVATDPTELNRQGPDSGTQYRSDIFYTNDGQKKVAEAYIAQLTAAKAYSQPIVTRVDAFRQFYPAEAYHQDYLVRHPDNPYIAYNDIPKVEALKAGFPDLYRAAPVLVFPGSAS